MKQLFIVISLFLSINTFGFTDPYSWDRLPTNSEISNAKQRLITTLTKSIAVNGKVIDNQTVKLSPLIKFHDKRRAGKVEPYVISRLIVFVERKGIMGSQVSEYNLFQNKQKDTFRFGEQASVSPAKSLNEKYNNFIAYLHSSAKDDSGSALGFAPPLVASQTSANYGDKRGGSSNNEEEDDGLWTVALGSFIVTVVAGMMLRRKRLENIKPNQEDTSKETKKKEPTKPQEKKSDKDKPITVKKAIENVNAPSMIPSVDNTVDIVKKGAKELSEIVDKNAGNVAKTVKDTLTSSKSVEVISDVDRLKGVKSVLENGSDLIVNRLTKARVDLHDIHSLKKIFDKNGKAIINNMDDVKKYADLLKKNDKGIKNLSKSSKAKKLFRAAGVGFEIYDAVDRVNKVTKERGYTKEDAKWATASEVAHKVAVDLITRNAVVGVIDGVVSIIAPEYNVESMMRKGEDAWHKETEEFFKNIYDNSDELATRQLKEFNRFKKKIMSKNISEEEKLKRVKKIYKIVVG
ncbi:MAG: Unknown protein [uncultured Sulfurovum sp.]|uniref:Uncharacterized protein n=1 Tax=uncultured Sulfurovum sp. TaxID=269237 RepID=A0A6S6S288_9BACT|nr:MAG: Unknown protein [uncultured Sulfurovum sp.]